MERLGWQRGLHYLVEANLENMIQVKAREFNTGTADADGYSGKAMLDSILEDLNLVYLAQCLVESMVWW